MAGWREGIRHLWVRLTIPMFGTALIVLAGCGSDASLQSGTPRSTIAPTATPRRSTFRSNLIAGYGVNPSGGTTL
jgi:hypothetical protein